MRSQALRYIAKLSAVIPLALILGFYCLFYSKPIDSTMPDTPRHVSVVSVWRNRPDIIVPTALSYDAHVPNVVPTVQVLPPHPISPRPTEPTGPTEPTLHPDVRILPSTPDPRLNLTYSTCMPFPDSPKPGVKICPHPPDVDTIISAHLIQKKELWEKALVLEMDKALKLDPTLMLFDIGCNIGEYTMWAAALDRRVVCVEMLTENAQRVQVSLEVSNLSDHVTIVNNALYSDHRVLEVTLYRGRMGLPRLNTSRVHNEELIDKFHPKLKVKTICIDDLTPLMAGKHVYIKMDIENAEHYALKGAHRFFKEVDVRIVQMEWHRRIPSESNPIIEFMALHGYASSYDSTKYNPVDLKTNTQNIDVFFMKKSFFGILK
ncbi:uncharacterized protein LOC131933912 [Physella acuta]|uniref:uncharacterized protein LOC131933912 n=1 Tax=Physella acuta TaxID=109671 RepID=UPI0027DE02D2|nr:uncharacterized protein LOC131933912 [Physella acuta]